MRLFTRLLEMFSQSTTRDRRLSTPGERAAFDARQKVQQIERDDVERRLQFLEAEISLLSDERDVRLDLEKRQRQP